MSLSLVSTIVPEAAKRFGDACAIVFEGREVSFTELERLTNRVASGLVAAGLAPGDRVVIYAENSLEWMLSYHGALKAGVGVGSVVYVAGAGPVGLAAAASARILGAAVVLIGDFNAERLQHAAKVGFTPVDLSKGDNLPEMIADIIGSPEVYAVIDAVGFEARGHSGGEQPAIVLNQMMEITRVAGGIGIPGLYVTEDPGAVDDAAKTGNLSMRFGLGWAKAQSFHTGQTPVLKYNRQLMQAILHDRLPIADIVNATIIPLEQAAEGYKSFDSGVAKKFVLDPHAMLAS